MEHIKKSKCRKTFKNNFCNFKQGNFNTIAIQRKNKIEV